MVKIKYWIIGIVIILFGFGLVWKIENKPILEYFLIKQGVTTKGTITFLDYDIDENNKKYISYRYEFILPDGKLIKSNIENSEIHNELPEFNTPIQTEIIYLPQNPTKNKVKNLVSNSMGEFFWRKILLGSLLFLMFLFIGVITIRAGYKRN